MKEITTQTRDAWLAGHFAGDGGRAEARVTIQRLHVNLHEYVIRRSTTTTWDHRGKFASAVFGQAQRPRELRNVKSIEWQRGVDQDVATCNITLYNVRKLPTRNTPPNPEDFDLPGWYTPNYGVDTFSVNRWNHTPNPWKNWIKPDRIIRTYEGYGMDHNITPEKDPHMYPSGVWLIDDVDFNTDGTIKLACRDVGRLLLDHILFPPVVPWAIYPLTFEPFKTIQNPDRPTPATGDWDTPNYDTDSNIPYIGKGITDAGRPYVNASGGVLGHHGRDAFDGNNGTFYLSVGNRPSWSSAYEYVQGRFTARDVHGIRVGVRGGPYRMYVSLQNTNGDWLGRARIPYGPREVNTSADIPYVTSVHVDAGETIGFKLPKVYKNIHKVRVTFSHLWDSGIGVNYSYRAAVRSVQVASSVTTTVDGGSHVEGNYDDYTDIVKWLCGWAGLYWPRQGRGCFRTNADDTRTIIPPATDDPVIGGKGRIWGDFEQTGVTAIDKLDVDTWDKRPAMDGIAAVRDMAGFEFWIDETGGAVFRMPNVFSKGNWLSAHDANISSRGTRTTEIPVIDERTTLIDMTATISSRNVRERVFIANAAGKYGAVVRGFNPTRTGLRRVGGWTDQQFKSEAECIRMADMIALRQSFLYRQNSITIAANPQLQIDDQVRIYERNTGEGYLHRILSISSNFDNESGKWTYQLTTNWLGEAAFTQWAFDPEVLDVVTQNYLRSMGKI